MTKALMIALMGVFLLSVDASACAPGPYKDGVHKCYVSRPQQPKPKPKPKPKTLIAKYFIWQPEKVDCPTKNAEKMEKCKAG